MSEGVAATQEVETLPKNFTPQKKKREIGWTGDLGKRIYCYCPRAIYSIAYNNIAYRRL